MKPIVWSKLAKRDAEDAAYWYASKGGLAQGERFLAAVETALAHIGTHPKSGSTRYAVLLKLDVLRVWPVKGFPYLVFYIEHEQRIDVGRVLHQKADIPLWMAEGG